MNHRTIPAAVIALACLGLVRPILAQTPTPSAPDTTSAAEPVAGRGDWERLNQLPKDATVTLRLRDGRSLKGTIQQLARESIAFVETKKLTEISVRDVVGSTRQTAGDSQGGIYQPGQFIQFRLRDGREVGGTVQRVSDSRESLWLVEPHQVQSLRRDAIDRVTKKSRWRGALIGLGIGAALGAFAITHDGDSLAPGETIGGLAARGAIGPGLLGAAIGAAAGVTVTIYAGGGR